jgi:hypothetical protein
MDKFVEKMRALILIRAEEEASAKGLDPKKISNLEVVTNNNKLDIKQKNHFIFTEYVSCCGLSEKITVIVYLTP